MMTNVEIIVMQYETGERNFRHVDLEGADLSNLTLKGVNFGYTDLRDVSLSP